MLRPKRGYMHQINVDHLQGLQKQERSLVKPESIQLLASLLNIVPFPLTGLKTSKLTCGFRQNGRTDIAKISSEVLNISIGFFVFFLNFINPNQLLNSRRTSPEARITKGKIQSNHSSYTTSQENHLLYKEKV